MLLLLLLYACWKHLRTQTTPSGPPIWYINEPVLSTPHQPLCLSATNLSLLNIHPAVQNPLLSRPPASPFCRRNSGVRVVRDQQMPSLSRRDSINSVYELV
ncbi:hypothetical protein E2C01_014905 [Portunus trituberculatus]|uniref:Secreted protein n=1 Tax=Portunus trituberculatus TaxID=210409 RepID=A0A5B7DJY6_PORTR|nr:hypothetical protein [Portunus trituberculatus]